MSYYVYIHKKKTTGEVFYIGKGKNWRATNKTQRNKFWKRVVQKHGFVVEIIEKDIQEWYAHELEISLIAYYGRRDQGRGTLVNLTDGGEGSEGYKHTEAVLGHNHPRFDSRIWKFKNVVTGEIVESTQYDFQKANPKLNVRSMVNRRTSTFDWVIDGYTPQSVIDKMLNGNIGEINPNSDLNSYSLVNLKTKEIFVGTRFQFTEKYGIKIDFLLCRNPHSTFKDWCLIETTNKENFKAKADYTEYLFIHDNGLSFKGTRRDMEQEFGVLIHDLVRKDIKKRAKKIKGWSLVQENLQ